MDHFTVSAPGRVNLIGEHTDYNDGFVLPMAIERTVWLTVRRRPDRRAVVRSAGGSGQADLDLAETLAPGRVDWTRYPVGVLAGYQRLGWEIPGFEADVGTDLPVGGGLSSSAALELATATAVETLCGRSLPPAARVRLCQRAEHEFAGVPCGIMDQFAVACGLRGHALLLDCRSLEVRHVRCDDPAVAVMILDSCVKHDLGDGPYALRREQCRAAARALGCESLRDVTDAAWEAGRDRLPPVERSRAGHVRAENARVHRFVAALERRDWEGAGTLMRDSHASLRDDYEVSCRELDLLVELASAVDGVFGCRMTGGGFGGCAVALVAAARAEAAMATIRARYRKATGLDAAPFVTRAAGGPAVA